MKINFKKYNIKNKDLYKKFEEILNELFSQENTKFNTPRDGFFKGLKSDEFSKEMRKYRNSVRESSDGLFTTISFIFSNPPFSDKTEINELKSKLDVCVLNQDFEEAAKLRDKIKELENNTSKVKDLKKELDVAIKEQNFERAIEIRDELKIIN
jgi:excinuclease UvrABC helicase subunit UvrB